MLSLHEPIVFDNCNYLVLSHPILPGRTALPLGKWNVATEPHLMCLTFAIFYNRIYRMSEFHPHCWNRKHIILTAFGTGAVEYELQNPELGQHHERPVVGRQKESIRQILPN